MSYAPPPGTRLRFGRYDYAAVITFAAYAASSLARSFALIPFSFPTMVALVLIAAPSRGGRSFAVAMPICEHGEDDADNCPAGI